MGVMSLAQILDKSMTLLRKYIKTIVLFMLGYGAMCFIVFFIGVLAAAIFSAFSIGLNADIGTIIVLSLLGIVFIPLIIALFLSTNVGLIKITSQSFYSEKVYAHHAIGASFKSIPKLWGFALSMIIILLPILAGFAVIFYLFYKGLMQASFFLGAFNIHSVLTIVFFYIGIIVLFCFALAIFAWFAFSIQVIAIERKGVFGALKRSCRLVKNNYWRILGCLILFYLTVYAVNASLQSFIALIAAVFAIIIKFLSLPMDAMSFFASAYTYASWPLSILSWLVITPIGTIMLTLLYFNQRFKKEGYDLSLRLAEIEKSAERMQASEAVE